MEDLFGILVALEAAKQSQQRQKQMPLSERITRNFFNHLKTGNIFQVMRLIEGDHVHVNGVFSKDIAGAPLTPLQVASVYNFHEVCKYLISKGAKVDFRDIRTKFFTPLQLSILSPDDDADKMFETCKVLILSGADYKLTNIEGHNFFDLLEREFQGGNLLEALQAMKKNLILNQLKSKLQEFFKERGYGSIHYGKQCSRFKKCKVKPIVGTRFMIYRTPEKYDFCPQCWSNLSTETRERYRVEVYVQPDKVDRVYQPRPPPSTGPSQAELKRKSTEEEVKKYNIFTLLEQNRFDLIKELVVLRPSQINEMDPSSKLRPIHYICSQKGTSDSPYGISKQLEQVSQLIRLGASKNSLCRAKRFTALHYAVHNSNSTLVKHLLRHSCNPNVQDGESWIPIYYAIVNESLECLNLLLPVSDLRLLFAVYHFQFAEFYRMYRYKAPEIVKKIEEELIRESKSLVDCVKFGRGKDREITHKKKGGNIKFLFFHYISAGKLGELKILVSTMENEQEVMGGNRYKDFREGHPTIVYSYLHGNLEIMRWLLEIDDKVLEIRKKRNRSNNNTHDEMTSINIRLLFEYLEVPTKDTMQFLSVLESRKGRDWRNAFTEHLKKNNSNLTSSSTTGYDNTSSSTSSSSPYATSNITHRHQTQTNPPGYFNNLPYHRPATEPLVPTVINTHRKNNKNNLEEQLRMLKEKEEEDKLANEIRIRERKIENERTTRRILTENDFGDYCQNFVDHKIYFVDFQFLEDTDLLKFMKNKFHVRRFLMVFSPENIQRMTNNNNMMQVGDGIQQQRRSFGDQNQGNNYLRQQQQGMHQQQHPMYIQSHVPQRRRGEDNSNNRRSQDNPLFSGGRPPNFSM